MQLAGTVVIHTDVFTTAVRVALMNVAGGVTGQFSSVQINNGQGATHVALLFSECYRFRWTPAGRLADCPGRRAVLGSHELGYDLFYVRFLGGSVITIERRPSVNWRWRRRVDLYCGRWPRWPHWRRWRRPVDQQLDRRSWLFVGKRRWRAAHVLQWGRYGCVGCKHVAAMFADVCAVCLQMTRLEAP